jgi:transketolase
MDQFPQPVFTRALMNIPLLTSDIAARSALSVQRSDTPLAEESRELRRDIVQTLYATGGGHYGGCLSVIDLLLALYRRVLRVNPWQPRDSTRDRLILSKGHAALAHYAVLRRLGFFEESLQRYASFGSILEGHPDMLTVPGVDFSTGSLGQGLSVGVGMAHAMRHADARVWVVLGDGECQEGQVWEAAMLAGMCGLGRLHAIVDHNRFQEWGWNAGADGVTPPVLELAEKWRAFGWRVIECDGHDFEALDRAIAVATAPSLQPSVILAATVKGRGVPMCEADPKRFHCDAVNEQEHAAILEAVACA